MAQTNACKVLFIASAASESLQTAIGNAGGIEALVDAMKEFDDDVTRRGREGTLHSLLVLTGSSTAKYAFGSFHAAPTHEPMAMPSLTGTATAPSGSVHA